jgi:succinate dehydrogenase / fumarate reductase flavoprotein subunit
MKIFPAVHYSMGGLWADYEANAEGGLQAGSPRYQQTSIENLYAIGECDYHYHGANRLGANSLLSCIFSGPSSPWQWPLRSWSGRWSSAAACEAASGR